MKMTEYERAAEASICQQRLISPLQQEHRLVPLRSSISCHAALGTLRKAASSVPLRKAAKRARSQVQRRAGAMMPCVEHHQRAWDFL